MSTQILLTAQGSQEQVQAGFQQAQAFVESCEKRFSRFLQSSELSELNRSAGEWFSASPDLFEVVAQAVRLNAQTGGLFDPSILGDLERAGYNRSIEIIQKEGAMPIVLPPSPIRRRFMNEVELDASTGRIHLPGGMRIDLGGIAKGWIAEQAAGMLSAFSPACAVDVGGDMFLYGLPEGAPAWQITLEDPLDAAQALAVLNLPPGAVVTSSIVKRRWQQGGQTRHHLIDPRTGQPAETDWMSVTAIAPHAVEAEVWAKALLVAGSQQFESLSNQLNKNAIEFIAVDQHKQLWGSKGSKEFFDGHH